MSDDFMSGGGAKSVPFNNIGDTVTGVIVSPPELRKQLDDDGQPQTFKSGDIMTMWAVKISTSLRDPSDPYDNGTRTLYLKWKSFEAVRQAVRASGAPTLQVGGTLTLTLSGFGPKNNPKYNPPKLWSAHYVPAPPQAAPDGFMNPPQPQYAPVPQGQYQQAQYIPQQYSPQAQGYAPQQHTQQMPVPAPMPTPVPMPPPPPMAPVSPAADTRSLLERMAGQHQANPYTNPPAAPDQDNPPF